MDASAKPVLVIGGGIAGIQASLEIANAGYKVYLVERSPTIGGHMAMFDKTFPTLDNRWQKCQILTKPAAESFKTLQSLKNILTIFDKSLFLLSKSYNLQIGRIFKDFISFHRK